MKHEWKKNEKEIYLPKDIPTLVKIPKFKYFTITGEGDPNNNIEFQEKISALYSLSYAVRMMPKTGFTPAGYFEYTVYPLEGIWDFNKKGLDSKILNKENFVYKIMIRQPEFINEEVFKKALENTKKKKSNPFLDNILFEEIEDGLSVQIMHTGPFDDEPKSFEKMDLFLKENNYKRSNLTHREIYLSNFNKVDKEKLKTVLRYFVE